MNRGHDMRATFDRRRFLGLCGAAAAVPLAGRAAPTGKPNILLVFADQLRSMDLGCYGGRQVRTPNIDRLAREGILFTNAVSTAPVCSPFRAMLMTGNHPMKNGWTISPRRNGCGRNATRNCRPTSRPAGSGFRAL